MAIGEDGIIPQGLSDVMQRAWERIVPPEYADLPMTVKGIETVIENHETRIDLLEGNTTNINSRVEDLEGIDFVDKPYLQNSNSIMFEAMINRVDRDYIQKENLGITLLTLPHREHTNTKPLSEHLVAYDMDQNPYAVNLVVNNIINSYLGEKLNKSEFNSFLMGQMTQETIDQISFTLADVDYNNTRRNLGDVLEELRRYKMERTTLFPGKHTGTLPIADVTQLSWLHIVDLNKKTIDELDLGNLPSIEDIQDKILWESNSTGLTPAQSLTLRVWLTQIITNFDYVKINGNFLSGYNSCFRNETSTLGDFVNSMKEEMENMRLGFSRIKDDFEHFQSDFRTMTSGKSAETRLDILDILIGRLVNGGTRVHYTSRNQDIWGGDWEYWGLRYGFGTHDNQGLRGSSKVISDKSLNLHTCGQSNLGW